MELLAALSQSSIFTLEFIATIAFAISGVLSALRKRMDIVGICACGFLAAFGGGTLRDVLLDRRPFFWVDHQIVLFGVLAISIGCAALVSLQRLEHGQRWLQIPDAIGLGLFCATGTHLSWIMRQPPIVAIMMGVITGTFGGVLRDLVCNEIPALFRDHRPYAICAAIGGLSYTVFASLDVPSWWAMTACALTTTGLRALAVMFDFTLPSTGRR
ncbi:MAG: hypothetical protein RL412_1240 [Pseudomonadota bacterium]|jgi:uncharacterized membrane protein YeiH